MNGRWCCVSIWRRAVLGKGRAGTRPGVEILPEWTPKHSTCRSRGWQVLCRFWVGLFDVTVESRPGAGSTFTGKGATAQSNQLNGEISVTIAAVYPNGTMLVRGQKMLTLNRGDNEFARVESAFQEIHDVCFGAHALGGREIAGDNDVFDLPDQYHNALVSYVLNQAFMSDEDWSAAQQVSQRMEADIKLNRERENWGAVEFYPRITAMFDDEW